MNFTPEALAGIFLGKVTKVGTTRPSLARIRASNFPGKRYRVVVHRSDGSGTTYIWTDYLSKVSDEWKSKVNKNTLCQLAHRALVVNKNEGVAGLVKQTPNAFGYVELIYAIQNKECPMEEVKNSSSGEFIKADLASVTAAAAETPPRTCRVTSEFPLPMPPARPKLTQSPSFTWLLIPSKFSDASKRDAIKGFVKWMLADGQNQTEALSYAETAQGSRFQGTKRFG